MDPSAISLSPHSTQTRYGRRSRYLPASATPTPSGSPWPSDPVATSTHGSTGVGWPSRRDPKRRYPVISSSSETTPTALYTEYSSGDAWPLEKIRWSLLSLSGLSQSYRRWRPTSTASRSAADMLEVG